jgi:choline dehydrogenase-like flavoprotein
MVIDARSLPDQEVIAVDLCIIGGGAAGIAMARAFAQTAVRVALLESGDFDFNKDTQSLYTGGNTGLRYFPLDGCRLRYFGGTTNHWGGYCQPLGDTDFEHRDWVPNSGWPISKEELWPYYEKAQALLDVDPNGWELEFWTKQDRFPVWEFADQRVINRVAQISPELTRRFGTHYRENVTAAANVQLYLNANVTQIETDDSGNTVTQLQAATLSGNRFAMQAKQFVLAAGGMENPRLLLLSDQQHTAGLGNQNDLVGRYFMEHPRLVAGTILPSSPFLSMGFYSLHKVGTKPIKGYISLSPEAQRAEKLVDIQVRVAPVYDPVLTEAFQSTDVASLRTILKMFSGQRKYTNFSRHFQNVLSDLTSFEKLLAPGIAIPTLNPLEVAKIINAERVDEVLVDYLGDIAIFGFEELFNWLPLQEIEVQTRIDPVPNPNSRVTLLDERDALGQRRASLHWELSELDKHSVLRTLEILGSELGQSELGRLRLDIDEDLTSWPESVRGGYHHMGTTRMHADPKQGVVDAQCRVHGLSNLYIAGSSVFPTAGLGTPTMTLLALALRLTDHLKGEFA